MICSVVVSLQYTGRYLQQAEHGVPYVEAVPPVVVGDVTVSLANGVHPSCQNLHDRREKMDKTELQ